MEYKFRVGDCVKHCGKNTNSRRKGWVGLIIKQDSKAVIVRYFDHLDNEGNPVEQRYGHKWSDLNFQLYHGKTPVSSDSVAFQDCLDWSTNDEKTSSQLCEFAEKYFIGDWSFSTVSKYSIAAIVKGSVARDFVVMGTEFYNNRALAWDKTEINVERLVTKILLQYVDECRERLTHNGNQLSDNSRRLLNAYSQSSARVENVSTTKNIDQIADDLTKALTRTHTRTEKSTKESKMENSKISKVNDEGFKAIEYYNGVEIESLTEQDIMDAITHQQYRIEYLEGLKVESKKIKAEVVRRNADIVTLVKILDEK